MWYILVYTEEIFANVMITASFEDRYVWSYDGTPIELFNGEEISGIEAPEGEELFFFVQLEEPGEYLEIISFGGDGELLIEGEGEQIVFNFGGGQGEGNGGPGGRQMPGMELESESIIVESKGEGTEHTLFIEMPSNGRFDISLIAEESFSDVSLVANWEYSDLPPVDPDEPDEPVVVMSCQESAKEVMTQFDVDNDGVLSLREFESIDADDVVFSDIDLNADETLEYREIVQELCTCSNELESMFAVSYTHLTLPTKA